MRAYVCPYQAIEPSTYSISLGDFPNPISSVVDMDRASDFDFFGFFSLSFLLRFGDDIDTMVEADCADDADEAAAEGVGTA